MSRTRLLVAPIAIVLILAVAQVAPAQEPPPPRLDRDDAVVVAVIDDGFNPYHWNFVGSKMPQHNDADPHNDLPLTQAPHTWLPGFPAPSAFSTYNELRLTLDETNPNRGVSALRSADASRWNSVQTSTATATHYYWLPGTKVIGAVDFAGNDINPSASNTLHGNGTSSVAVGNIHGTCPECLVVFITYASCLPNVNCPQAENALNWAMKQPWIDVITNSYGFSTGLRDRIYDGGNAAQQRAASERGQTILFSAGNGQANTFTVPNTTHFSSQEGPDWTMTVGAVHPQSGASYTGHGKPADVASIGGGYPSGYGGTTVTGSGAFGGTSNATPVVAGMYANALLKARRALPGPSRAQAEGVVAVEDPDPERGEQPFVCASTRPACELGDGILTAKELRTRVLHGAVHTPAGMTVSSNGIGQTPPIGEDEFANEGHGTYFGRLNSTEQWQAELARITGPMLGTAAALTRPAGEREWMIVDSYCRQGLWLQWADGYYVDGQTQLPDDSPTSPLRTALRRACEAAIYDQLPNLVPLKPYDIAIGNPDPGTSGTALRLSVSTANRGRHALELAAVPNAGFPETSDAYQCVMWTTHRVCQERKLVGRFVFHQAHLHYHFDDYAEYELRKLRADGTPDMSPAGLAAPGVKASFCLIDYDPDGSPSHPVYSQRHPLYTTCTGSFGVGVQGISPGWKDTYVSSLAGQQILIDGVPDGDYAVVVTADPSDKLYETNERDNVSYQRIRLSGGGRVVTPLP